MNIEQKKSRLNTVKERIKELQKERKQLCNYITMTQKKTVSIT
ncbi:MAG: hypothetical protein RL687_529 [Candidatus Parcubacteria bacterium]